MIATQGKAFDKPLVAMEKRQLSKEADHGMG
jgi:hypothetical protein